MSDAPLHLRQYQNEGAQAAVRGLKRSRCFALLDEPGLGKTRQALLAATTLSAERILVVSPAGARRVWIAEIEKWYPEWLPRVVVLEPGNPTTTVSAVSQPSTIVLAGYDLFSGDPYWVRQIARQPWDLLILDEAHYLKNSNSRRTLALYGAEGSDAGVQASATHVLLLSGTLAPNHCGELYPHMRTFWPQTLRSPAFPESAMPEEAFVERACTYRDTPSFGRQITGSQNVAWLRNRLAPYVLRRLKAAVLSELPPLVEQDIPLDVSPEKIREALDAPLQLLERKLLDLDDDKLWSWMRRVPSPAEDPDETNTPLATLRRRLGELKVAPTAEWVLERLACGVPKIVVIGWHVQTLHNLHRALREMNPVLVTGQTPTGLRARYIENFQTRAQCRVFIGQMLATGVAVTLTAAPEIAVMEASWVPGQNRQARDRVHRIGQHANVICTYLYLSRTLDERILRVMRRKAAETHELIAVTT